MTLFNLRSIGMISTLVAATGMVSSNFAQSYDYSHRKSKATLQVAPNADVKAKLIRNHFGFGASITMRGFNEIKKGEGNVTQEYGDAFLQYFDFATPENEMKWPAVQGGDEKSEPDFSEGDNLVKFCDTNNIRVRGHNLFWNEKKDWLPDWTLTLSTTEFKNAMKERIVDAMTHYNGKVAHWDIVNEIIHGEGGSTPTNALLETMSGDPNIFAWILDEARKIDKTAKFVINDYNIVSGSQANVYINKCKPLGDKFDIIGAEGHFGNNSFSRSDVDQRINTLSTGLNNKKVWLTEVDWAISVNQSPAKMEELMRTCFANQNCGGLILWVWVKRNMWRDLTSYLVDSLMTEAPTGAKWKSVRAEWKTDTSGTADASGNFSFTGYQGEYQIISGTDTMRAYLYPKDSLVIIDSGKTAIKGSLAQSKLHSATIRINGNNVKVSIGANESQSLYLSTYSISGKLISRIPLNFRNGTASVEKLPSGCHVYRVCSDNKTYYSGMGVQFR